ncbi:uncharacterized protein SRS1_12229 [Sporisorium reilianum f. sp. reilianum]|uniref:Uncharacterized protein n=1 Tax=Sporisorium reilianum f. sp. reilianum TaxID=72559 RepID=A0A2N8U873_9BASI|nr:uncharacterized protein SRS1_12229 [Sporisorium reilianum f. sp. reilianum]
MSKRAAIAKASGVAPDVGASEHRLLQTRPVGMLARHLMEAISSVPGAKRGRPSRSACSQLALQVLVVAAGVRRAALVDSLDLSTAQASAISSRLATLCKQRSVPGSNDLQHVRLLYHAATGQTFIVGRQQSLWADMSTLDSTARSDSIPKRLWIDARLTADHASPTRASPDSHIRQLLERVHQAILEDATGDVLIVSQAFSDPIRARSDNPGDARLVGVALAGFLLEYGSVYCLHTGTAGDGASHPRYDVRSFGLVESPLAEPDFAPSPPNCLGLQPLSLFKILWHDAQDARYELLSFSIPQCATTSEETEHARQTFIDVFQTRVDSVPTISVFAHGRISVQVTTVTLHQITL